MQLIYVLINEVSFLLEFYLNSCGIKRFQKSILKETDFCSLRKSQSAERFRRSFVMISGIDLLNRFEIQILRFFCLLNDY